MGSSPSLSVSLLNSHEKGSYEDIHCQDLASFCGEDGGKFVLLGGKLTLRGAWRWSFYVVGGIYLIKI